MFNRRNSVIDILKKEANDEKPPINNQEDVDDEEEIFDIADLTFRIRPGTEAKDVADAVQLALLYGYIECAQEFDIDIDDDIYMVFEKMLQEIKNKI